MIVLIETLIQRTKPVQSAADLSETESGLVLPVDAGRTMQYLALGWSRRNSSTKSSRALRRKSESRGQDWKGMMELSGRYWPITVLEHRSAPGTLDQHKRRRLRFWQNLEQIKASC